MAWIFRYRSKWQKWFFDLTCALRVDENVWEFLLWLPFKLLGCFVLHTPLAVIMWSFYFLAKAQYDNAEFLLCANAMRSKWQNAPSLQVDIFATATPCNPLGRLFCKRLNMTKPLPSLCYKNAFCPSLRAVFTETAWQSINLNANLPLDCHEFARSCFANSRNDKVLVILSAAKYPLTKPWKFKRYAKARCKSLKQSAKIILFSKLLNSLSFLLKIEPFAKH